MDSATCLQTLLADSPVGALVWVLQSRDTWLSAVRLTVPTLDVAVERSPFFHYDYSSSSQRLPLEFLVELLKFPLPTQCALPVLELLCLECAPKKV